VIGELSCRNVEGTPREGHRARKAAEQRAERAATEPVGIVRNDEGLIDGRHCIHPSRAEAPECARKARRCSEGRQIAGVEIQRAKEIGRPERLEQRSRDEVPRPTGDGALREGFADRP
jgi:hypothetical protein